MRGLKEVLLVKVFDLFVAIYYKFKNYRCACGHSSPSRHRHARKSLDPIRRCTYLCCFVKSDLHWSMLDNKIELYN